MNHQSKKSQNNLRGDLVSWFKHCEKMNLIAHGSLNYNDLERHKVGPGSRASCTPEELQRIFDHAKYLQDQVILGVQAQAGLRHAEGLRFRLCFVDWEEMMIRLPGFYKGIRVTKTGLARDIPLCPALYGLLLRLKQTGFPETDLVTRVKNWADCLRTITKAAGVKVPYNGLRHGFGSHRRQITKSADQTGEDMGTNRYYVNNHYSLPQLSRDSEAWFAVEAPVLPSEESNPQPACGGNSAHSQHADTQQ